MSSKNRKEKVHVSFSRFNEKLFFSSGTDKLGVMSGSGSLHGRLARTVSKISRSLSYTSTRSYGAFMLSFGFLTVVLHLLKYTVFSQSPVDLVSIVIGVVFSGASIPLLLSDNPMCVALQDNFVTDYLLFEFFAIKRMHRINNNKTIPPVAALFLGLIPAGITFVLSTEYVALILLGIVLVAIAFVSPEFPMLLSLVTLPYLNLVPYCEVLLTVCSLISFVSFAIKVFVGKRVYNFEIYDVIIILFVATVFISGIFGKETFSSNTLVFMALVLSYFPASNLIANRRLADLALNALIVSSVPVSIYSIVEFFMNYKNSDFVGIKAFFDSTTSLVALLSVSAILTIGFVIQKKAPWKKLCYTVALIIQLATLGLTVHSGLPFALLGVVIGYIVVNMRNIPCDIASLFLTAVYALVSAFPKYVEAFLDKIGFSADSALSNADLSFAAIGESLFLGIGTEGALELGGFNLLTWTFASFGIIAFALLSLMILFRIRHISYFRLYIIDSSLALDSKTTFVALFALFMLGSASSMLSDPLIYYLFFALYGIGSATLRSAKKEHEERLGYYSDIRSSESSAIDVILRR